MHGWHGLNKGAASGVDGLTAEIQAANLEGNVADLAERVKAGRYRAKLVRRVYIPKENGKERPLGIPALEDKLVQLACAKLLGAIDEEDFLDCSHGYRPGRNAKDTVCDLTFALMYGKFGFLVEADIRGFFEHSDHDWRLRMLAWRIDDSAFLTLIAKWLKAGILDTDGKVLQPDTGTPQGGIVSPVLANVYLHQVLDLWFERVVKPRCRGEALLYRYADDFVCAIGAAASARALPGRSSTAPWRGAASRSPASPRSQRRIGCLHEPFARARASTTEEPDAGILHVRDCAGGAGQPASLRLRQDRRTHLDANNLNVLRHPDTDVLLRYGQAQRAAPPCGVPRRCWRLLDSRRRTPCRQASAKKAQNGSFLVRLNFLSFY